MIKMVVIKQQINPLVGTPRLDYTQIMNGGAREDILKAMRDYSFFYIINIPDFDPKAEVDVMKSFFSMSQNQKDRYASAKNNPCNSNVLRGK